MKRSYFSKEEFERKNNYILVYGSAQEPYTDSFCSRKTAENFAAKSGIRDYMIVTRKQFSKKS